MPTKWIYELEELGQEYSDIVGKKCANLGEMAKLGLRVPPGFAVTLEAYEYFFAMSGAGKEIKQYIDNFGEIETIQQFNDLSTKLQSIIHTKDFPPDMKTLFVDRYRQLGRRCGIEDVAVATRSAGAKSHPGQYETHLNVRGEADYLEKIKMVWASSFNPRSLSARRSRGLPLESDPIGVAVLKMANARSAGVLFTADPNTGDPSKMIVESNWGLGESVVGGQSMPDVFVLHKEELKPLEKTLGSKKYLVRFKDVGVVEEKTPPDMREQFSLTDRELSEIGRLGKVLEAHFDIPQDTEWAVDQDFDFPDSVILLQTRPEIIAKQKEPVDQVLDMMTSQFGF